jgi:hypothetical protein
MPSEPGAIKGVPSRMFATKFSSTATCWVPSSIRTRAPPRRSGRPKSRTVRSDEIMSCCDKDAGGSPAIVDDSSDLVLDRDVASETERHLGVYRPRHAADPLPQVQLVGRLVDQNAAAFAAPGGAPSMAISGCT